MREAAGYRYFIGCRPDARSRAELALAGHKAGQQMRPDLYHLTFCVVAELADRDRSLARRIDQALAPDSLQSVRIPLRRVLGGSSGARAVTRGRQSEIQHLYRTVVSRLALCGLEPLDRKAGFRPHVTLGYQPCRFEPFDLALDWTADELLLIESEVGLAQHHVLRRWPLLPPRQAQFDFGPVAPVSEQVPTAAVDPGRRSAA
jgi:2'-5' RNA ligase